MFTLVLHFLKLLQLPTIFAIAVQKFIQFIPSSVLNILIVILSQNIALLQVLKFFPKHGREHWRIIYLIFLFSYSLLINEPITPFPIIQQHTIQQSDLQYFSMLVVDCRNFKLLSQYVNLHFKFENEIFGDFYKDLH